MTCKADPAKPPYRVPSMAEIAALPWNGFAAASTFSGTGGSSLGYRMAGFKVLWASEFIDAARESYIANMAPGTIVDGRDIRRVRPEEILEATGLARGELDLLDGSPPCASFSTAGAREAGWNKVKKYSDKAQRTDDLFFEFARILRGVQPRTFVAENVSGLVKGTAKGYFLDILKELKGCGYKVEARLLDAQWLGVPQARQRLIFIGVRNDLGLAPAFPKPLPYRYSVRDALPWIEHAKLVTAGNERHTIAGRRPTWDAGMEPAPTITATPAAISMLDVIEEEIIAIGANAPFGEEGWQSPDLPAKMIGASPMSGNGRAAAGDILVRKVEPETDISRYAVGKEWGKIKPGEQSERYFQFVKPALDAPCPTICASHGAPSIASVVHPTERRKFSIAELKRICGFPDDFKLTGSYAQQWERLGRAVPPVMMRHIAEAVRDGVLKRVRA